MKNQETSLEHEKIKDAVYKTILSIEEMADAENPTLIKDNHRTPEEKARHTVPAAGSTAPDREWPESGRGGQGDLDPGDVHLACRP